MTPSALAGGRQTRWTREAVIEKIKEWHRLYGEVPRAADWSPASARWSGQTWRTERYRAGDWPSLNAAKRPFGGSLTAAIEAAGFEANKPGPPSRREAAAPEVDRVEMHPLARARIDAAEAEARELREKLEVRDRMLVAARAATERARAETEQARRARRAITPRTRTRTRTKTKTKVVTERVADPRAERARARADERAAEAREVAQEAQRAATRLASRLERAEATINTLRGERKDLRGEVASLTRALGSAEADGARAEDRRVAAERMLAEAEARAPVVKQVLSVEAEEVEAARVEVREARHAQRAAEERAATAEREYRELAVAARGEERKLTKAELDELRARGPSGPALLGAALKQLAEVRAAGGNPTALRGALRKIASAAVSWSERL